MMLLLLWLGMTQLYAAITVRLPNLTGIAGDTLTVPVYLDDDITSSKVTAYQFQITYSASNVVFLGASTTGTISQSFGDLIVKDYTSYLSIAGAGNTALTGKGILLNLRFALISSGSNLQFKDGVSTNYVNEGNPVLTCQNGYITIQAKPVISISPSSSLLTIGDTQQFSVSGGTNPYTWKVSDNSIATVDSNGKLTALKRGSIKVQAYDAKGYKGETGEIEIRSLRASIRDTNFYQNNFIDIPVLLENLDATKIFAGKFSFSFSENVLAFKGLTIANSLLDGNATLEYSSQSGKLIVTFAGSKGITGSGVLFKLRFKIADINSGASSINFDETILNETLNSKNRNGYFSIKSLPNLSISSASVEMYAGDKKQFTVSGGAAPYSWQVEDTTLASVNNSGYLTAISGGVTKLLVRDTYGSKTSAAITIYDTWVNVRDSAAVVTKQSITIPIDLGNLPTGKGVISLSGKAMSSFAKIDSIKVSSLGTLTESWQLVAKLGKNQTSFALSGVTPITKAGKIATLKIYFNKTLVVGDAFYIDCNELMLNEGNPKVKVKSGYITIKSIISGLKEIQIIKVSVFPNPTTSTIQIKGIEGNANLKVFGIDGKLVLVKQFTDNETISVGNLATGIYTLRIQTDEGLVERKLIKK